MADQMAEERGDFSQLPPALEPSDPEKETEGSGGPLRLVAFTALAGLVLAAASVLPYSGVGLVLLGPILLRASATLGHRRSGLVPPMALVLASPMLLLMPLLMMTDPVVESGWRCGNALMGGLVALPMMAFIAGLVAAGAALVLVGFMPRVVTRLAPHLRAAVLLVAVVLVVAGTVRLFRFPQPEEWTHSLRVAARSTALDAAQLETCREGCKLPPLVFEAAGQARTLLLECEADRCAVRLGDAARVPLRSDANGEGAASPDAPVEVRVHDGLGVVVVAQQGRSLVALDVRTGEAVDVPLRDVAGEVAPSAVAVLAMAFAVAVALHRTRRALGERAAVTRLSTAIDARVDDAGVVHPNDGSSSFRPAGAPVVGGPAVILGRPKHGTYRSGADRGTWVLAGTRAAHLDAHRRREAVFDWEAVAVLCIAGAPLFAAALRGLLL